MLWSQSIVVVILIIHNFFRLLEHVNLVNASFFFKLPAIIFKVKGTAIEMTLVELTSPTAQRAHVELESLPYQD